MRPAPCGYSSARFLRPHSFLSLSKKERKKRIAAPGEEKKENFQNRNCKPCRHHVTAQLPCHICPPQITPNCDLAQRSQFGKEEGASGYGVFAAPAETEWSWLLLTRWRHGAHFRFRRFSFFSNINRKATQRSGRLSERKKEPADMELSPPRRKRNAAGFF